MKFILSFIFLLLPYFFLLQAQKTEEELIHIIQSSKIDSVKINRMMDLFDLYVQNDLRKAKRQIELVEELSQKSHYKLGLDEVKNLKGKYHLYNQDFDSSVYWHKKFYETKYVQSKISKRINALNNIGNSFSSGNQLDSAYFYLNKGLELARKHQAKEICAIFNNLGLVLAKQSNIQGAISYFELAHQCFLDHQLPPASQTIINLATLYSYSQKPNPDTKIQELLKDSKDNFSRNDLVTLYINLGMIYNENRKTKLARNYFHKADSIHSLYSEIPMPNILHGLATTEILDKNPKKALVYFQKIYSEFPHYSERLILIKDLAKLNFELGNHAVSKKYYEELISLKDSIYHTEIENTILIAQKDVDFYEKEIQVRDLELDKQILESKRNKERIGGIAIGLILLLAISWIWIFYKKEKTKRKINELEIQNKNLKINEFYDKIEQRNKVIQEIESSFVDYKNSHSIQDHLKQTIIDSLDIQGDREIYNYYFEDQHKGFYTALKNLAPDLTNNELRLCSLTKLRMSLKETANVLNLSVDAIKSGRYRIKKKLNLEAEENLTDFLNKLND